MNTNHLTSTFILLFTLGLSVNNIYPQCNYLVWADEFNESTLDLTKWNFDIGPTNDNVHFYTNREKNVYIENGSLKIAAFDESFEGYNYTSGLIKTERMSWWKYGRIEARIKLPQSPGFVPAFWMLPEDNSYGWWPKSGEIDIMEHPTNEVENIYGTVHTAAYNYFTGTTPKGGTIAISDAESEFHIYAIEWNEEKIDFFVDDQKYFTFNNDQTGTEKWPFNNSFYIILNLAVGGGWVGNPNSETIFPAIMEVDYVRVYQNIGDISITGNDYVLKNSTGVSYSLPFIENATYNWSVSDGSSIASGINTSNIEINFSNTYALITSQIIVDTCNVNIEYPVVVTDNFFSNPGFEKGVKYWYGASGYPASTDFKLVSDNIQFGNNTLNVDIKALGNNPWDIQVSQKGLTLQKGVDYNISFWAKTEIEEGEISLALINPNNFTLYFSKLINPTKNWTQYSFDYKPTSNIEASFNLDFGYEINSYFIDNFEMKQINVETNNLLTNSNFSDGSNGWSFTVLWPAVAEGTGINGEYFASIDNGGQNAWDVNLSQAGLSIEQGKEYEIIFDAYSVSPRTISCFVGKNSDPWTVYSGSNIIAISNSKQTYRYTFTMQNPNDASARLGFDIGGNSNDVYFDNIYLFEIEDTVSTDVKSSDVLNSFSLEQNYPNPFNPSTTIKYSIPLKVKSERSKGKSNFNNVETGYPSADGLSVRLVVYDILGREVKTLVNKNQKPGNYEVNWDATNHPSGIYFYMLRTGSYVETKKMILLR